MANDLIPEHEEVIDINNSATTEEALDTSEHEDLHEFVFDSTNIWTPDCAEDKKPFLGKEFVDLDIAFEFYKEYGRVTGFDVRRATQKTDRKGNITLKYFVCSNAGFYKSYAARITDSESSLSIDPTKEVGESSYMRKRTASTKCGCPARIVLKKMGDKGFFIKTFIEKHNHKLANDKAKQFLRCSRYLTMVHKQFIVDAAKSNIGPTRAHGIYKSIVGSYSNVGATSVDFKNFSRDIKLYIGKHDSDMILQKFKVKNETSDNQFQYEYQTDENNHLTRLFWADALGRRSYDVFGDVVSFDATYRTNRYNMVFVPFIGIDNHGKSVTFAAALLDKEDVENFLWVCNAFLKIMGRPPKLIITDQCPAMKIAISKAFPGVKHRFCMWHIMKKFPSKLGPLFCAESKFMEKLNKFVWSDHSSPIEFEEGWKEVIDEFELSDNVWLSEMYEMRSSWIPAYFNDDPMAGLLRTTSRSESSNFYFNHFVQKGDTLSEFYICYESAIEKQRYINDKMNHSDNANPRLITKKKIEENAVKLYTRSMFYKVREEIQASCGDFEIEGLNICDGVKTYDIRDRLEREKLFQVIVNINSNNVECSCKLYTRVGYLCKHSFFCLTLCGIHEIPVHLVKNRWLKNAEERFSKIQLGEMNDPFAEQDIHCLQTKDCWFDLQSCIAISSGDKELTEFVYDGIKALKNNVCELAKQKGHSRMDDCFIEKVFGTNVEEITVLPPLQSNNKGSRKRIVGLAEKTTSGKKRQKRECKRCGQMAFHDSRNCPEKTGQDPKKYHPTKHNKDQ